MIRITLLSLAVILSLTLIAANVQAASVIADWTFESGIPTANSGSGPITPEVGTGTGTALNQFGHVFTGVAGNGSPLSWTNNNWTVNDYWQFGSSSSGFSNISLEWDADSSNTGPRDFTLQYSTDGTSFTAVGSTLTWLDPNHTTQFNASTFQPAYHFSVDLSTVTALNNAASVYFRLVDSSTTSANGGTIAAGGTSRMDNFTIKGVSAGSTTFWDVNGASANLGGTGTWNATNTNWNDVTGTATAVTFDPNKNANFAGTAGTVTIASGGIGANSGITFGVSAYTVTGDALTLGAGSIDVTNASDTATINAKISGSNGLKTAGAGTLVLGTTNDFSGNVVLGSTGTVQISSDANLGANTNDITLNGGKLKVTGSISLDSQRDLGGTGGTLNVPSGATLTVNGSTSIGNLNLADAGTVDVKDSSQTAALTLASTGTLRVGDGTGTLFPTGNVSTTGSSGIATVAGNVDFNGTPNRAFAASAGTTLVITGNVHQQNIAGGRVFVDGPGTIDLQGADNSDMLVSVGTATGGFAPATVIVHNSNSLGVGEFRNDSGVLHAASAITFNSLLSQSIDAFGTDGQTGGRTMTYEGADMNFTGNTFMFEDGPTQQKIFVNNNTTWSGGWGTAQGTNAPTGQLGTGTSATPNVLFAGSGTLTVSGTIDEDNAVIVDGLTMNINSAMSSSKANFTIRNGGTLKNGVNNALNTATSLTVGTTSSGTYNLNGFNQTLAGVHLRNGSILGSANTLTSTSTFDMQSGTVAAKLAGSVGLLKTTGGTVWLNGNNSYSGGTTVAGGLLGIGHLNALGTGGLNIRSGATAQIVDPLVGALALPSLTIEGGTTPTGTLDITDNNVIVRHANYASAAADLATLTAQVTSGFNGFTWTGTGITSSTAVNDPVLNAVGIIPNTLDGGDSAFYPTWPVGADDVGGPSVDQTDVLIKYTYTGDANLDGVVDADTDYALWNIGLGSDGGLTGWLWGDFDYSGTIDIDTDYALWNIAFSADTQGNPLGGGVQPVPEPSTLVLAALGLAGVAAVARRRRLAT